MTNESDMLRSSSPACIFDSWTLRIPTLDSGLSLTGEATNPLC